MVMMMMHQHELVTCQHFIACPSITRLTLHSSLQQTASTLFSKWPDLAMVCMTGQCKTRSWGPGAHVSASLRITMHACMAVIQQAAVGGVQAGWSALAYRL